MNEKAVIKYGQRGMQLTTFADAQRFAYAVVQSGWCPPGSTEASVIVAMQAGAELGLSPMQSIQNVTVVGGKPKVNSKTALALCMASPAWKDKEEGWFKEDGDGYGYWFVAKRKGASDVKRSFTVKDAKRAKLWAGDNYQKYPQRMFVHRARSYALEDQFPDVLAGISIIEDWEEEEYSRPIENRGTIELQVPEIESGPSEEGPVGDDNATPLVEEAPPPAPSRPVPTPERQKDFGFGPDNPREKPLQRIVDIISKLDELGGDPRDILKGRDPFKMSAEELEQLYMPLSNHLYLVERGKT
jgi:hypothetical protein